MYETLTPRENLTFAAAFILPKVSKENRSKEVDEEIGYSNAIFVLAYPFGIACSSCKPPFKGGNSGLGCKNQARYFNCPQIDGVRIRLSKYWQEANHSLKKIYR